MGFFALYVKSKKRKSYSIDLHRSGLWFVRYVNPCMSYLAVYGPSWEEAYVMAIRNLKPPKASSRLIRNLKKLINNDSNLQVIANIFSEIQLLMIDVEASKVEYFEYTKTNKNAWALFPDCKPPDYTGMLSLPNEYRCISGNFQTDQFYSVLRFLEEEFGDQLFQALEKLHGTMTFERRNDLPHGASFLIKFNIETIS